MIEGWLDRVERARFWCAFRITRPQDNTLIAECRQIIREVVVPAAEAAQEGGERRRYLESAMALVRVANATGDTIARLRGEVQDEIRQRIIVERIEKTAPKALPGE